MVAGSLESSLGSSVRVQDPSSVHKANAKIAEFQEKGQDLLTPVITEFDSVITTINNLNPSQIDANLAPHLKAAAEMLMKNKIRLPTLNDLKIDENQETRQAVDGVLSNVRDSINDPESRWGWLNDLHTPRSVATALYVEGYEDILKSIPTWNENFFDKLNRNDQKVIVLAFEEALVLHHLYNPDDPNSNFRINRPISRWYEISEGFTQDFVDYVRGLKLMTASILLEPDLKERQNMKSVFAFVKEKPHAFIDLVRTVNATMKNLNEIAADDKQDEKLLKTNPTYTLHVKDTIKNHPLPRVLEPDEKWSTLGKAIKGFTVLRRALVRTNRDMKNAEKYADFDNLPQEDKDIYAYLDIHKTAKTPEEILAGLLVHTVELWTKEQPAYQALGFDAVLNALCEVIGYKHSDSRLFKLLYNPQGLNWYDPQWGFSQEFVNYLKTKTKQ